MKRALLTCAALATACGVPVGDASYIATGFETGSVSEWQEQGGASYFENGATLAVVTERARSGRYSARITLPGTTGAIEHAAFGFRGNLTDGAYYSASFFFPERYTVKTIWTLLEFRGELPGGSGNADDVQWALAVQNRPEDGEMVLRLWNQQPASSLVSWSNPDAPPLPVGRWVHLEGRWKKGTAGDGAVTFWQDGVEVFDRQNVTTTRADAAYWEATSFADQLAATIYLDDVMSTSVRMGPLLSQ